MTAVKPVVRPCVYSPIYDVTSYGGAGYFKSGTRTLSPYIPPTPIDPDTANYIVGKSLTETPPGYTGYFTSLNAARLGTGASDINAITADTYDERLNTVTGADWVGLTTTENGTILKADSATNVLNLQTDIESIFDGLTFKGRDDGSTANVIYSQGTSGQKVIQNCFVNNVVAGHAIQMFVSAAGNTVANNQVTVSGAGHCVLLYGNATISGNSITTSSTSTYPIIWVINSGGTVDINYNTITKLDQNKVIRIDNVAVPMTSINVSNNTFSQLVKASHGIIIGNDLTSANNGSLNGAVVDKNTITGLNASSPDEASNRMHSILIGHSINPTITRNYVNGGGYGMVYKGTSQTDISGNISFNFFKDNPFGTLIKGVAGVKYNNNTIISTLSNSISEAAVSITDNAGVGVGSITQFKNNIIKLDSTGDYLILIDANSLISDCDYNAYISTRPITDSNFQIGGVDKTWPQWVAAGNDAHSFYIYNNGSTYDIYLGSDPSNISTSLSYCPVDSDGQLIDKKGNPLVDSGVSVTGVNDGGELDLWGYPVMTSPNIGASQKYGN